MVMSKRIGLVLKEAREARKLSLKDAARDTNIILGYLEALESEDYSKFPGETYVLGFLKTYSEFLNLDTDHLINMYRGLKIDQSATPLQELTKPTGALLGLELKSVLWGGAVLFIAAAVWAVFLLKILPFPEFDFIDASAQEEFCTGPSVKTIMVPESGLYPQVERLPANSTIHLVVDGITLRFCFLQSIQEAGKLPLGDFAVQVENGEMYRFSLKEHQNHLLDANIHEFAGLKSKILIIPHELKKEQSSIQLSVEGAAVESTEEMIRVTLQFVDTSYIEWESDGNFQADTLPEGSVRIFEAKDRLLIKIGNGGGVKLGRGQDLKIAGPPGRIVKFLFEKVPNPLDKSNFRIEESKEVVE